LVRSRVGARLPGTQEHCPHGQIYENSGDTLLGCGASNLAAIGGADLKWLEIVDFVAISQIHENSGPIVLIKKVFISRRSDEEIE
jgi:hypothetical protein